MLLDELARSLVAGATAVAVAGALGSGGCVGLYIAIYRFRLGQAPGLPSGIVGVGAVVAWWFYLLGRYTEVSAAVGRVGSALLSWLCWSWLCLWRKLGCLALLIRARVCAVFCCLC